MATPVFTADPQTGIDAFADVVNSMKTNLQSAGVISPVLSDVTQIASVVDKVLNDIHDVPKILSDITMILTAADSILDLLDAVPFVDVVAEPLSVIVGIADECVSGANEVISQVDTDIVTPCIPIFDDISKGLNGASNVVNTMTQTVPDYLNTIAILSYMTDIADILVNVLKGTAPGDNLKKLSNTYLAIRSDALKALTPISDFLKLVNEGINKIKSALGTCFNEINSVAQGVIKDLEWVKSAFDPIIQAFHKIVDAIAPIKWLLEAIGWLFKYIFDPILNGILELTGLNHLMDVLKNKIQDVLGVTPIKNELSQQVSKDQSKDWQSSTGSNAVSPGQDGWTGLTAVLSKYSTRNPNGVRNDVLTLVNTILGTDIDPKKDGEIPDWPDPPSVTGDSNFRTIPNDLYSSTSRANSIQHKVGRLTSVGTDSAARPIFLLSDSWMSKAADPVATNSAFETLQTIAQTEIAALKQILPVSQTLTDNLGLFDQAKNLPDQFNEELSDFTDLFSDAKTVIDFLIGFEVMKEILADIESPVNDQLTKLNALKNDIAAAESAGSQVDLQVAQLLACFPNNSTITNSIHFIDSVATGAKVLSAFNDQITKLDTQLKGIFADRIQALMLQVNDAIAATTNQIQKLSSDTQSAVSNASTINTFLTGYAGVFVNLSKSLDIVTTDALPKLSKGVNVLNSIASILDPLSAIIQQMNCTKKKDGSAKTDAAGAVEIFKSSINISITAKKTMISDAFSFVVNKEIPIDLIQANMASVKTFFDRNNPDSLINDFSKALNAMTGSMNPTYSYTINGSDGKPRTVKNVLIDEDFKNKASALMTEMQAAAKAAGINPGQL